MTFQTYFWPFSLNLKKKGIIVLLFLHSDKHYLGHISEFYKKDPYLLQFDRKDLLSIEGTYMYNMFQESVLVAMTYG